MSADLSRRYRTRFRTAMTTCWRVIGQTLGIHWPEATPMGTSTVASPQGAAAERMRANTCAFFITFSRVSLVWVVVLAAATAFVGGDSFWTTAIKTLGPLLI